LFANSFFKTDPFLMLGFLPARALQPFWVAHRFGQMWTMTIEIQGSMVVYLWMYFRSVIARPRVLVACATLTFALSTFHVCFFIYGASLRAGFFTFGTSWPRAVGWVALVASLALRYAHFADDTPGRVCAFVVCLLRCVLTMYAAEHAHLLRVFLESSPSLYLGKLSFTMYIFHNIGQYVLFDYASYGKTPDDVYADPGLLVIHALATLGLSIGFGVLFYRVETASSAASKSLAALLLSPACDTQPATAV
jgi:peptidoglycan/LPS O-acetylase OafA/YrhL